MLVHQMDMIFLSAWTLNPYVFKAWTPPTLRLKAWTLLKLITACTRNLPPFCTSTPTAHAVPESSEIF